MKKLLVDARMIHEVPHGISKFVEGIALGLSSKSLNYELVFLITEKTPKHSPVFNFATILANSRFLHPEEWIEVPKVLKAGSFDGFHSPSLSAYPYLPVPYVVTIHDLNHLQFGSLIQKIYYQSLLKFFAKQAFQVTTVSEFSKKEISDWLGPLSRPIEIIWNPIEKISTEFPFPSGAPRSGYFLSISGDKPHKNIGLLYRAYEKYRSTVENPLPLYVGATPLNDGVVRLPNIPTTQEMAAWLHHARGCLFPSLYEGFGRAPVEAVIAHSKLAVSDIPPHREGLRDIPVQWTSPSDIDQWVDALIRFHRGEIAASTESHAQILLRRFSPEIISNSVDPIYRSMLLV